MGYARKRSRNEAQQALSKAGNFLNPASCVLDLQGSFGARNPFDAGVELLNPFNSVTYNPRDFDPDFISDIGPQAAIAVGLAARKVGDR